MYFALFFLACVVFVGFCVVCCFFVFVCFLKEEIIWYLHSIQICPIKSMAVDAGKTIIVEFPAKKDK